MRHVILGVVATLSLAGAASAQLDETFPDPLIGWTTRWLYLNTNMGNYYVAAGNPDENNRGNNPEGLWIVDTKAVGAGTGGPTCEIFFNPVFGATLASLSFGVEAFVMQDITIFDLNNNPIGSLIGVSGGGFDFDHKDIVSAVSANGIGRILFDSGPYGGGSVEGNTSVDNFHADLIPAPGAAVLLALGGLVAGRRRRA